MPMRVCVSACVSVSAALFTPGINMCVTVRLPVTATVMHSGAQTNTQDSAGYGHRVYFPTNNKPIIVNHDQDSDGDIQPPKQTRTLGRSSIREQAKCV